MSKISSNHVPSFFFFFTKISNIPSIPLHSSPRSDRTGPAESVRLGPQALDISNEGGNRRPPYQAPWPKGHAQACGSRRCSYGPSVCHRPKQFTSPHNETPHDPAYKTHGQTGKHKVLTKHRRVGSQNPATKVMVHPFITFTNKGPSGIITAPQRYSKPILRAFEEFAQTDFFQRQLQLTKNRVKEKAEKKRKLSENPPQGRLCRFCTTKQGPNSKHIHTGVAGKYS